MRWRSARWLLVGVVFAMLVAACGGADSDDTTTTAAETEDTTASTTAPDTDAAGDTYKLGLITKFPVDFFFTIEDAAKEWADEHPDVELITGMGESASDDEGVIALIESMVTQGVDGLRAPGAARSPGRS